MQERSRFYIPGIILGSAFFFFILGQVIIRIDSQGPQPTFGTSVSVLAMISTLISLPICFVGIIVLAFALGKPGDKGNQISMTKIIHDIKDPSKITIPYFEQQSESNAQNYALMMILLSFLSAFLAIASAIVSILSSLGGGLGFSGGSCESFCESSWNFAYYSCIGGIVLLVAGVFAAARPWSWFGDQTKVVLMPTNESTESIESTESNREDFSSLTVLELKVKLKERGLPVSGKKADLIARLNTREEVQEVEKYIHNCHNCKQKLKIPVGYEGRIKCPSCDTRISI
jgi:hypothetical protein